MSEERIAVVGAGNILMGDEGVGVRLLEELEKHVPSGKVDFIEAGTAFFAMVSDLEEYDTVVIIDAACGGGKPGTMYRFGMNDLAEILAFRNAPISLHEFGVPESIAWERARGRLRANVIFFGIEPSRVEPFIGLSDILEEKVGILTEKILEELSKHGVEHAYVRSGSIKNKIG